MPFLILYVGEDVPFDVQAIINGLRGSSHVIPLPTDSRCTFSCEYRTENDTAEVCVRTNGEAIVIDGIGEAALSAAIEIQRFSPAPIHMVDDNYSFDMLLTEHADWTRLHQAILDAEISESE